MHTVGSYTSPKRQDEQYLYNPAQSSEQPFRIIACFIWSLLTRSVKNPKPGICFFQHVRLAVYLHLRKQNHLCVVDPAMFSRVLQSALPFKRVSTPRVDHQ